jgi:hypothetical protein
MVVVGVLTPQYRGAGGATLGSSYEGVGEAKALIDDKTLRLGHVLKVVGTHVVGKDQDYVRLARAF